MGVVLAPPVNVKASVYTVSHLRLMDQTFLTLHRHQVHCVKHGASFGQKSPRRQTGPLCYVIIGWYIRIMLGI